jgi:hypothetical protein
LVRAASGVRSAPGITPQSRRALPVSYSPLTLPAKRNVVSHRQKWIADGTKIRLGWKCLVVTSTPVNYSAVVFTIKIEHYYRTL